MAILYCLGLAALCLSAHAFPQDPQPYRNNIFNDEKLEGGVFEDVDAFNDISLIRSNNPFRLPTTTLPSHYKILWTIELPERQFAGDVDIQLYATQADVNEIFIHAHDLNITSVRLFLGSENDRTEVDIQDYTLLPEYHFLRVRVLNGVLAFTPNQTTIYTLSISFNAPLRTDMYGIYESWFRNNHTDEVSWMASTQFQATAARFAFPCYDEPSFKATFDVTIRRPVGYRSWFCTRLYNSGPSSVVGFEDDEYYITPRMSTYLLALIVAEYESYPPQSEESPLYEVIARPGAMNTNQGEYAYEVGQELLAEMSNHTAFDFYSQHTYLKMTQAAIPDFGAGAMENWGLLTYREAYLMYDPIHTNGYYQQLIAYILSHEIAHMWFGNMVTCDWWDVLWLNEGFARYYQYFLTDWVEDHMGLETRFITEQIHTSLLSDSANNPQPLSNPGVGSPASVSAMFSTISYNKGAAIIRMTEHLLGFYVHRQGLRNYLEQKQFDTALPIDLFNALQEEAVRTGAISEYGPGFNVVDYYKSWTEQGGHPVLNVQVDHQTGLMTIYQRRFNLNSGYSTPVTNWFVPITFYTASNPDYNNTKPSHVLTEAITVVNRSSIGDEWVIFNTQQTGFYRVNYDDYTWDLIALALRGPERTLIHEYNRAQIVNDVFQFARSGVMSYNRAFNLISFLRNETEYAPWVAAITGFNWILERVTGTPEEAGIRSLIIDWSATAINTLGYRPDPEEEFMTSYRRYQLAPFVCRMNVTQCREEATAQFNQLVNDNIEVPKDSRNWVYCNALRDGTADTYNYLWRRFLEHNVYTEKILILSVLGCTNDETSLYHFLDEIVTENFYIRGQDYTTAFSSAVSGNEENTQIVFKYIQENLTNVTKAFASVATPLSYISSRLRTIEEIEEFERWADDNRQDLGSAYQSVRAQTVTTRQSLAWTARVQADIQSYITQGDQALETSSVAPVVPTQPSTVPPPALQESVTPDLPLPDSAHTTFLSAVTVIFALTAYLAL